MSQVKLLLLAGAGTSIELGVPGMSGMAQEFIEHALQWDIEPDLVNQLLRGTLDVEHLIEEVDRICSARASLGIVGEVQLPLARFDRVRAEIEWFIQHAAERVLPRDAHLMWGSILRAATPNELTLVTTNYDRAIELAANAERVQLDDGFGGFSEQETAEWSGFGHTGNGVVLVKLHGSTDWYADAVAGNPIKLRHPMPLFGRATLRLPHGVELGSALILPSREKLLTRNPYPRLSQAFLNACDASDVAIFVGSSLRDHHLRDAAQALSSRVPTFIVSPEGSTFGITNTIPIPQTASHFLIATLPAALRSGDAVSSLKRAAKAPKTKERSTLSALRAAVDDRRPIIERCAALEELDNQEAMIDGDWLKAALNCNDSRVARYAFGLIPQSPDRDELLRIAEASSHKDLDPAYAEDLELLSSLLNGAGATG